VFEGETTNVKLTTPGDFEAAETLVSPLARLGDVRTGTGFDVHAFTVGDHVWLNGVRIAHDQALSGHSDADVLSHAVADALLGAIGAGDIGQHFPNTDAQWKNASGLVLLARTVAIVRAAGWSVANVDATIVLERPKILPHVVAMREQLAHTLGLSLAEVSVKAKTNEGVDATGRGEAIAAHAVAVLGPGGA